MNIEFEYNDEIGGTFTVPENEIDKACIELIDLNYFKDFDKSVRKAIKNFVEDFGLYDQVKEGFYEELKEYFTEKYCRR